MKLAVIQHVSNVGINMSNAQQIFISALISTAVLPLVIDGVSFFLMFQNHCKMLIFKVNYMLVCSPKKSFCHFSKEKDRWERNGKERYIRYRACCDNDGKMIKEFKHPMNICNRR
jgi:hypothetical protein